MTWDVEYTGELDLWWSSLDESQQESVSASVGLLEVLEPNLGFPHSTGINGSRHEPMRELRVQHRGRPYRMVYAFDPLRLSAPQYCCSVVTRRAMTAGMW